MRSRRIAPILVGLALVIGGCTSDDETTATTGDGEQPGGQQGGRTPPGGGEFPGASGLVAAVEGKTLQVQGTGGQVAVTYTDDTAISETVEGKASDIEVGSCVSVQSDSESGGDQGEQSTEVTATGVSVTDPAEDGSCQAGFGGGAGSPSGGDREPPTEMPENMPEDMPEDFPGGGEFGGGTSGEVTAIDGTLFTVEQTMPSDTGNSETSTVTVTTTSSTTWTVEVDAGPDALAVGTCVTALGTTEDTGAVAADSLAVRPAEDGECTGFGGMGFGGGGGGA